MQTAIGKKSLNDKILPMKCKSSSNSSIISLSKFCVVQYQLSDFSLRTGAKHDFTPNTYVSDFYSSLVICMYNIAFNSCNTGTRGLPDMYTQGPQARGLRVYISGRPRVPVLQLLHM